MTQLPVSMSDYTTSGATALTSAVDQVLQYQQGGFAFHTWMQAMGATVERSSDGTNAGAGNNITLPTGIVFAASGVAHAWAVYAFATGMRYLIDFINVAGDATPQAVVIYQSFGAYTGGSATTRPTAALGGAGENSWLINLIAWATPVAGSISYAYSTMAQIGWFWIKENGNSDTSFFFMVESSEADDPMRDPYTVPYGVAQSSVGASGFVSSMRALTAANLANGFHGSGRCNAWNFTIWTNGLHAGNFSLLLPIQFAVNISSLTSARHCGSSRLLRGVPPAMSYNARNPADPALDVFTWWTIGDIAVLWRKSDGDIP